MTEKNTRRQLILRSDFTNSTQTFSLKNNLLIKFSYEKEVLSLKVLIPVISHFSVMWQD